jgi:hypothetical protein
MLPAAAASTPAAPAGSCCSPRCRRENSGLLAALAGALSLVSFLRIFISAENILEHYFILEFRTNFHQNIANKILST